MPEVRITALRCSSWLPGGAASFSDEEKDEASLPRGCACGNRRMPSFSVLPGLKAFLFSDTALVSQLETAPCERS